MVGAAALAIGFSQNGKAGRPANRIQAILKKKKPCNSLNCKAFLSGVADGARTHDNRNHNPGLYQLSYSHQKERIIA